MHTFTHVYVLYIFVCVYLLIHTYKHTHNIHICASMGIETRIIFLSYVMREEEEEEEEKEEVLIPTFDIYCYLCVYIYTHIHAHICVNYVYVCIYIQCHRLLFKTTGEERFKVLYQSSLYQ